MSRMWAVSVVALLCVNMCVALDFTLERYNEQECFFEDITEESRFEIQYHVISGGFMDVDFKVIRFCLF